MADKVFPTTEADLNLLLQNLAAKLGGYKATLALTTAEVDSVVNDAANFEYIITIAPQITDTKDAFFSFKSNLIDGTPETTAIVPPVFPLIATPDPALPGIKRRTRNIIQRIKTAPGFTETIGEDLGIIDSGGDVKQQSQNSLTAALTLKALSGSRVEIAFSKQGQDAMRVEFKRKTDTDWNLAGVFTASPGVHEVPSIPPGDPESRQYRGILLFKNSQAGNFSPIYTVVTTP